MNTLKVITGILFFLQCFTFTVLAESLPKFAMIISNCFSCGALLGAAFCKGKLGSGNKPQPQGGLAQDRSACLVLT